MSSEGRRHASALRPRWCGHADWRSSANGPVAKFARSRVCGPARKLVALAPENLPERVLLHGVPRPRADTGDHESPAGPSDEELVTALAAGQIIVGFAAYPLMQTHDTIGGLAFRFILQDGSATVLVMPRDLCENVQLTVADLNGVGWTVPEVISVPGLKPN